MNGFAVEPGGLDGGGRRYDDVRQLLADLHAEHSAALAEFGDCWGSDEPGAAFGRKYCGSALATLATMDPAQPGSTVDGLQSVVDGIHTWARNYVDVEDIVHRSTPRVDRA